MAPLSDQQVTLIFNRIIADGVTNRDIQSDLLDHYCCFIEEKLSAGIDFDSAYQVAFQTITPNGMHEIQEELYYLLGFKQITIMKRIIYGASFLTAFFISTGIMFKTMHWTGGPILLMAGFFLLIITAVSLLLNSIKNRKAHSAAYNMRAIAGLMAALLIATGGIFKILACPTASMQIVAGLILLNFIFLPLFFYQLYQGAIQINPKTN